MTERATTRRRRRSAGATHVPAAVAAWFAGEPRPERTAAVPWAVRAYPGHVLLPEWWQAWCSERPDAVPPTSYAWLADPTDQRHRKPVWLRAMAAALQGRTA